MPDLSEYLVRFNTLPPATEELIAEFERRIELKLPVDYVDFLKLTNGGDGFIGNSYLALWGVDELTRFELGGDTSLWSSELLVIGSDGGNETYAFDTRASKWSVVQMPWAGFDWKDARVVGDCFDGFLRRLYETELHRNDRN